MMGGDYSRMCEPVVPNPTAKAKSHRNTLMIIGFIHLALAIMYCFILPMNGIYEIIDVMILFCALAQMNYCCLIIYLINITINFFISFNQLGLWVQTGQVSDTLKSASFGQTFAISIIIALTIFYVVASIFCFFAYREFKGMLFDHNGGAGGFGLGGMRSGAQNAERVNEDRREAYGGQGHQIGGGGGGAARGPPGNSAAA